MGNYLLKFTGLFIAVIFLQIFVFNNIQLSGYINPYFYIVFILLLPYNTPKWILLLLGFSIGLTIDAFMNTYGMHTSASTLLAFLRPYILMVLTDREDIGKKGTPKLNTVNPEWFIKYVFVLVFAHHLLLFFVESFTFTTFFHTLWRTILSTIASSSIILVSQLFNIKK